MRSETVVTCAGSVMKNFHVKVTESVRKTFKGKDDIAYEKEQKKKRVKKSRPILAMPDEPCCGRCDNWHPPYEDDDYGSCSVAFVVRAAYPENSRVVSLEEAAAQRITGMEWNRTAVSFLACSLYKPIAFSGNEE